METIRPSRLQDFVGQAKVRTVLDILIRSAKKQGKPIPHILLSGPPGLGKTTLARIVAEEMGGRLIEVVAANIQTADQMVAHLLGLKRNDVLFIDEVHGIPRAVEECLYSALEDRRVTVTQKGFDSLMKQIGMAGQGSTVQVRQLPAFTCVGATTLAGLVSDPLRTRFGQTLQLEPYGDDDLALIAANAAAKMSIPLSPEVAMEVARRSRSTARVAVGLVSWLAEFCSAYDRPPDAGAAKDAFALRDVDAEGLTALDLSYLAALADSGAPVGLSTLASSLAETRENLEQAVEPFLIRKGYVRKDPRGRVATPRALEKLGRTEGAPA